MHRPSRHLRAWARLLLAGALVLPIVGATTAMADTRPHRGDDRQHADRHDRGHGKGHKHKRARGQRKKHDQHRSQAPHRYSDRRGHREYYYDRHDHDRHYHYRPDRRRAFRAPRTIHRSHYVDYGAYYRGTVFYEPHRHAHRVYLFPAWIDGVYSYAPYAYCDGAYFPDHFAHGELYYDGSLRGRVGIHLNF